MNIRQVAEGAYFVPSYSEQTVLSYQPQFTNQTIIVKEIEEETIVPAIEEIEENVFSKDDFEKALRRVSVRVK
ncbi:hypothetical protein MUP77_19870 [Candidatus Bathyarchaeota archaeon]|nr:hypothetical protein [Candidatus Bathyarchaeota archaeon]